MCVLALHDGVHPADDELRDIRIPSATSTTSRTRRARRSVDVALSNAMGLGGHNGCVLLGRVDADPAGCRRAVTLRARFDTRAWHRGVRKRTCADPASGAALRARRADRVAKMRAFRIVPGTVRRARGHVPRAGHARASSARSTASGVSSASESSTTSASASASSPGGKRRFGIATTRMPAGCARADAVVRVLDRGAARRARRRAAAPPRGRRPAPACRARPPRTRRSRGRAGPAPPARARGRSAGGSTRTRARAASARPAARPPRPRRRSAAARSCVALAASARRRAG